MSSVTGSGGGAVVVGASVATGTVGDAVSNGAAVVVGTVSIAGSLEVTSTAGRVASGVALELLSSPLQPAPRPATSQSASAADLAGSTRALTEGSGDDPL